MSHEEKRQRIREALDSVEAAQAALREAQSLLSPIPGWAPMFNAAGKTEAQIREFWDKLNHFQPK